MERFKDIIYENTDVLLGIVVILLIGFVINNTFSVFDGGIFSVLERTRNSDTEEWQEWSEGSDHDQESDGNDGDSEAGDQDEEENENSNEESITITIPENSLPQRFAEILQENDLVENEQDFINRLVELQMDRYLRAGTYEIPEDATLDEIIEILTRRSL